MRRVSIINRVLGIVLVGGLCAGAQAGIIHRYSFNDGSAKDSVGKVDGKLVGTGATVADGKLVLKNDLAADASKISYLEFAGPVIPKSGSVTIVFWMQAKDVPQYSRVLDFGTSVGGDGNAFIYFTARTADDRSRAAISATDVGGRVPHDGARLDDDKVHMVAVVINGTTKKMQVFIDGKESESAMDLGGNTLDAVKPVNNYLGRSSFDIDPGFSGSIDEFRVYDHPMTAAEVTAAHAAGPNLVATAPATQPGR